MYQIRLYYFQIEPDRIVISISTSDFVGDWTAGQDSFAENAPNAALIIEEIQIDGLDTAEIELFNPIYDTTANTLTYTVMSENATSVELPREFGQTVLVIDNVREKAIAKAITVMTSACHECSQNILDQAQEAACKLCPDN